MAVPATRCGARRGATRVDSSCVAVAHSGPPFPRVHDQSTRLPHRLPPASLLVHRTRGTGCPADSATAPARAPRSKQNKNKCETGALTVPLFGIDRTELHASLPPLPPPPPAAADGADGEDAAPPTPPSRVWGAPRPLPPAARVRVFQLEARAAPLSFLLLFRFLFRLLHAYLDTHRASDAGLLAAVCQRDIARSPSAAREAAACRADLEGQLSTVRDRARAAGRAVLGAAMFTCGGRGERFFGEPASDARSFARVLPGAPLIGFWAGGEVRTTTQGGDRSVARFGEGGLCAHSLNSDCIHD